MLLLEWNVVDMLRTYSMMISQTYKMQLRATAKEDGVGAGTELKHYSQALLESMQGMELDGSLQLINCIASVNHGR